MLNHRSIFLILILSLLFGSIPTSVGAQDVDNGEGSNQIFLPLITGRESRIQPTYTFEPAWLDVTDADVQAAAVPCAPANEEFDPDATAANANADDICLVPGLDYPVVKIMSDGQNRGYVLGGNNGVVDKSWTFDEGSNTGQQTTQSPNRIEILSWPNHAGIPNLPAGDVTVMKVNYTIEEATAAATSQIGNVTPGQVMEFGDNLLDYINNGGDVGIFVPAETLFLTSQGLPGKAPVDCGVETARITLEPSINLMSAGVLSQIAVRVRFTNSALHTCMLPYNYLALIDLMFAPAYSGFQQKMDQAGNDSWRDFTEWAIVRPSPQEVWTISWITTVGGATIYTIGQYLKVSGEFVLRGASSILIVPTQYLECLGMPNGVCTIQPEQSLAAKK